MKERKHENARLIPDGITDIGDFAFRNERFDGIKSVVIPNSVE